jgi:hypothetical protein
MLPIVYWASSASNMPLLYGEGSNAFLPLQEELIRTSSDQSIFGDHLLAYSPDDFRDAKDIVVWDFNTMHGVHTFEQCCASDHNATTIYRSI